MAAQVTAFVPAAPRQALPADQMLAMLSTVPTGYSSAPESLILVLLSYSWREVS